MSRDPEVVPQDLSRGSLASSGIVIKLQARGSKSRLKIHGECRYGQRIYGMTHTERLRSLHGRPRKKVE